MGDLGLMELMGLMGKMGIMDGMGKMGSEVFCYSLAAFLGRSLILPILD